MTDFLCFKKVLRSYSEEFKVTILANGGHFCYLVHFPLFMVAQFIVFDNVNIIMRYTES